MGLIPVIFRHYLIFLRGGNGPPYRIFHTLNLKSFELKTGVLKAENEEFPYEMLAKGTCVLGEDHIVVLGSRNNLRPGYVGISALWMDLFWLTVDEDVEQQSLSISAELLPMEQDVKPNFTRFFGSFVKKKNFYVLGTDGRFPEILWEFNASKVFFLCG